MASHSMAKLAQEGTCVSRAMKRNDQIDNAINKIAAIRLE